MTAPRSIGRVNGKRAVDIRLGSWPSGIYFAEVTAAGERVGYAPFVLSPRHWGEHKVAIVFPTQTWQAYNYRDDDGNGRPNTWYGGGGKNVTLYRPFTHRGVPHHFKNYAAPLLRWAQKTGHDVDYLSDGDLNAIKNGDQLRHAYELLIFEGHHEYVTDHEYDIVTQYRDLGGNLDVPVREQLLPARQRARRRDDARRAVARPRAARGVADRRGVLQERQRKAPQPVDRAEDGDRVPWLLANTELAVGSTFSLGGIEADHVTSASPRQVVVVAKIANLYEDGRDSHMTYYETPPAPRSSPQARSRSRARSGPDRADTDGEPLGAALEGLGRDLGRDVDVVALCAEDGGGPVGRLLARDQQCEGAAALARDVVELEVLDVDPLRAERLHDRGEDPRPVGDVHLHAEELGRLLERVAQELLALRRGLADPAREEARVAALERRLELLDPAAVLGERGAELRRVVEEDVHPDARVRAGDARHLAERRARRRKRIVPLDRRGADLVQQQVRERVRQVAHEREQPVVRLRVDRDGNGAERGDERVQGAVARALRRRVRRQEPGRALEEVGPRALGAAYLGAGDGMAADEALVRDGAGEHALRRADVRHGRRGAAASAASTAVVSIVT